MSDLLSVLIIECVDQHSSPEAVLDLEEKYDIQTRGQLHPSKISSFYKLAVSQRFPQVIKLYLTLVGSEGYDVVARLTADLLSEDIEQIRFSQEEMADYKAVYRAGISLSWWLFGLGKPLWCDPDFKLLPPCAAYCKKPDLCDPHCEDRI